jgi:LysR family carnitine catabolism transcriptional activator
MNIRSQPINLLHLKFFYDAVMLKSVSAAASKNFVTQSAISQGISKLEKILGVEIVTHSRQNFGLTAEGRIVFEHAKKLFLSVNEMHDKIEEFQGSMSGSLCFACTNSLAMSFIAETYEKARQLFPLLELKPRLGGFQFIQTALKNADVEFAIVVDSPDFKAYSKQVLKKGQFHLYKHKNAKAKSLESGLLVDDEEGMYVSHFLEQYEKEYKKKLPIQAELGGWEVVARFTEKNIGYGFFPDYVASRYCLIQPCKLSLTPFQYEIAVIYPKGHKLSRAASAFIELF